MRTLEISLLVILTIALFDSAWSNDRKRGWENILLPMLALFVFIPHALLEGIHWQMVPAYGVALCLILFSLAQFAVGRQTIHVHDQGCFEKVMAFIGLHLAFLALAVSLLLTTVLPVYRLPAPSGPYPVGVQDIYLVDETRPELFTPEPDDHRELMVRVWYPASPASNAKTQPAWPEVNRVGPRLLERFGLPTFLLSHLKLVQSYSHLKAPLADDVPVFPVLIFSHGYTDDIAGHQTLIEEFASHGYIVFSLGHTYESMATVFPGGRIILADNLNFTFQGTGPNHTARPVNLDEELSVWVADAVFLLDRLEDFNADKTISPFAGRLDMEKLGVFGMSFGGAMSTEVCLKDSRCKAGANMDGGQFGFVDFSVEHLKTPFFFFYNEYSEGMNDHVYRGVENQAYRVTVAGTTHSSFTDKVLWSPYIKYVSIFTNQNFGPIDAQRIIAIKRAYLLAFFDRHLKGENTPLLDGPSAAFPEVDFQFRTPSD